MATAFEIDKFASSRSMDRVQAVRSGVPASALRDLTKRSPITLADLAGIVAPRRTLDRRLKEMQPLTRDESDRLLRFLDIYNEAKRLTGSADEAIRWLRRPKWSLNDEVPLDLMATEAGARVVQELFLRASHGMLA